MSTNDESELDWNGELSFKNLQPQGLIHTNNEWEFIKQVFEDVPSNTFVTTWLKSQKDPFRVSHLMHKFIAGYIRKYTMDIDIPKELHELIIKYCNLIFVKIFYSKCSGKYELRTFDASISLRSLAKLYEIESKLDEDNRNHHYANCVRIWLRFGVMKIIYTMNFEQYTMKVTMNDINQQCLDQSKWREIPDDYLMGQTQVFDKNLAYDEILEIGVDILDKDCGLFGKWSFDTDTIQDVFDVDL